MMFLTLSITFTQAQQSPQKEEVGSLEAVVPLNAVPLELKYNKLHIFIFSGVLTSDQKKSVKFFTTDLNLVSELKNKTKVEAIVLEGRPSLITDGLVEQLAFSKRADVNQNIKDTLCNIYSFISYTQYLNRKAMQKDIKNNSNIDSLDVIMGQLKNAYDLNKQLTTQIAQLKTQVAQLQAQLSAAQKNFQQNPPPGKGKVDDVTSKF